MITPCSNVQYSKLFKTDPHMHARIAGCVLGALLLATGVATILASEGVPMDGLGALSHLTTTGGALVAASSLCPIAISLILNEDPRPAPERWDPSILGGRSTEKTVPTQKRVREASVMFETAGRHLTLTDKPREAPIDSDSDFDQILRRGFFSGCDEMVLEQARNFITEENGDPKYFPFFSPAVLAQLISEFPQHLRSFVPCTSSTAKWMARQLVRSFLSFESALQVCKTYPELFGALCIQHLQQLDFSALSPEEIRHIFPSVNRDETYRRKTYFLSDLQKRQILAKCPDDSIQRLLT